MRQALGYSTVRDFVAARFPDGGITENRVSAWERGDRFPDPETLGMVLQATGATADYLMYGVEAGLSKDLWERISALSQTHIAAGGPRNT